MIEDGSSFKQLAQKLSDGRHEVIGLSGKMVVVLGVTIMVCS